MQPAGAAAAGRGRLHVHRHVRLLRAGGDRETRGSSLSIDKVNEWVTSLVNVVTTHGLIVLSAKQVMLILLVT